MKNDTQTGDLFGKPANIPASAEIVPQAKPDSTQQGVGDLLADVKSKATLPDTAPKKTTLNFETLTGKKVEIKYVAQGDATAQLKAICEAIDTGTLTPDNDTKTSEATK